MGRAGLPVLENYTIIYGGEIVKYTEQSYNTK